jgi:hypothetical protein
LKAEHVVSSGGGGGGGSSGAVFLICFCIFFGMMLQIAEK